MKLVYLLGFLSLVAAGSNKKRFDEDDYYKRNKHKNNRIVGGTEAFIQDMPFMASLIKKRVDFPSGLICTAVIIQPYWALMAASSLEDIHAADPNFLERGRYVIRSNTGIADDSSTYKRDHVIVEYYTKHLFYDSDFNITRRLFPMGANLGLVKVKTAFNAQYEKPIKIVSRNYQYKVYSEAIQAGWGYTKTSKRKPSLLRKTDTRLTYYRICRTYYRYFHGEAHIVTHDMVCTYADGRGPCIGDIGGPLIQDGRLIGILAYGKSCGVKNWPDVYTKISKFVTWIQNTVFNVTKKKVHPNRFRTGKIIY